jgi:hypothetical protein
MLPKIIILLFLLFRIICGSELSKLGSNECPPSSSKNNEFRVLADYWRGNWRDCFSNACNILYQSKRKDPVVRAVLNILTNEDASLNNLPKAHFARSEMPSQRPVIIPRAWEILGPLPVGKLEVDGDPSFDRYLTRTLLSHSTDVGEMDSTEYLLGLDPATSIHSEMVSGGTISWSVARGNKANGLVTVQFPGMQWNEVAQGTSSFAAFEFQGWARTTTHVAEDGQYSIHCPGVHTIYIRSGNCTSVVAGDVYRAGLVRGSVFLRRGPVGIVLPLRGAGSTQLSCTLTHVPSAKEQMVNVLDGARMLSNLLQLPTAGFVSVLGRRSEPSDGLLLSPYFCTILENPHPIALNITFTVQSKLTDKVMVRLASTVAPPGYGVNHVTVESGQVMTVPLELYTSNGQDGSGAAWEGLLLPCSKGSPPPLTITFHTSGAPTTAVTAPFEFSCRTMDQSWLLTFLDQDGSAAQAAVVFPLGDSRNKIASAARLSSSYPVLLTLHGTGISPMNQADAYKQMPGGGASYDFGVQDFFVVAPSRHGAHNWEAIGAISAWSSVTSVQKLLSRVPVLPQLVLYGGIIAGHSMGKYSTVQYSTVQYSTVQYSTVWIPVRKPRVPSFAFSLVLFIVLL